MSHKNLRGMQFYKLNDLGISTVQSRLQRSLHASPRRSHSPYRRTGLPDMHLPESPSRILGRHSRRLDFDDHGSNRHMSPSRNHRSMGVPDMGHRVEPVSLRRSRERSRSPMHRTAGHYGRSPRSPRVGSRIFDRGTRSPLRDYYRDRGSHGRSGQWTRRNSPLRHSSPRGIL